MQIARKWARLEEFRNTHPDTHLDITAARLLLQDRSIDDLDEDEDEDDDANDDEDDLNSGGCGGAGAGAGGGSGPNPNDYPRKLELVFPNLASLEAFQGQVRSLAAQFGIEADDKTERIAAVIARVYKAFARAEAA